MKTFIRNTASILFVLMLIATVTKAQQIPDRVKKAFTQKFPNVQHVEWGKESAEEFEAEFILDGQEMSANFDTEGNWKETEVKISNDELPDAVKATLQRDFEEAEVKHAFKVTTPEQTLYEVAVANGEEEGYEEDEDEEHERAENEEDDEEYNETEHPQELVFTADGKLVKKNEAEEE